MTIGMWIAALIAVLCLCALGYLLTRQEPGSKPITALDGLPEQHWIGPADWKQALIAEEPTMDRKPKFEVYKAKKGYRWRLLSANGRTLCSGESHTRARDAARAARTVIETAAIADVVVKS